MAARRMLLVLGLALMTCGARSLRANAAETSPSRSSADAAAQADALLRAEVPFVAGASPGRIGDEIFLRRASLDLVGHIPTPQEITAFVLDPAADKRDRVVQKLLADPRYGENWGRYWRDVIMYRKTEERAQIVAGPLEEYLVASFNANKPWSQIATEFVTALGDATENGACGLIIAQQGQPEEVTAEVSRIFLGVQIQCAQCHDHPTDRWKREQFHELAAFFPRVASRLVLMPERREISVVANDSRFAGFRGPMNMRRNGTPEHYMTDLKNPQARGTLMTPAFFANGQTLPLGTKDADRRGTLARWMTEPDNPYFAKAFVNRIWSELCGEGFYEPVDDMGPDRTATAPQTLDCLAKEFAAGGYDVRWLLRTIMATEMYQLPSAPRRAPGEPAFQANVAQRLRADQLFDNLLHVLDASEPAGPASNRPGGGLYGRIGGPRAQFTTAFGYDPSQRRDEVAGSIPQALTMMNAPVVNTALRGTGRTMLARLLAQIEDNDALVQELYLKTLAREPSQSERTTCLLYVKEVGNRTEAFEDILWSLVNSTEFLRRG